MSTRAYTALGWTVWQIGSRVAKRKLAEHRGKLWAAGLAALLLGGAGGVAAAAKAGGGSGAQ